MTKTRRKDPTPATPHEDALTRFAALVATAGIDSDVRVLQDGGASEQDLNEQLTRELRLAQDRWGLGLLHLRHSARLTGDAGQQDIALDTDGMQVALLSEGARSVAGTYAAMQALGADGLSEWGVLEDGPRVTLKPGLGQIRVLVEDARDFETRWSNDRAGVWSRTWRKGDTLGVEVHRPASPVTALADAAWDVITGIKDRTFQRELMERSNSVGMLGALLGARHSGAVNALERLPEAHFAVSSAVVRQSGEDARSLERWKAMLREGTDTLDELQKSGTRRLAAVLSSGLR
ncbi:DNA repair protein [Deinococcus aquiradiocola]|uniref:DNA repair protein PprA n=1 Tax=Deinococcus aquiradiocola TaxID=393059 RepID=A0A917PCD6_9DEIO|nr:DNA repair protein [Deinococcus aquiradiocola]GGJ70461.1 DNA repair protein PprA [Deinococcus aquiradiocola]